jgi:hypothetical protein
MTPSLPDFTATYKLKKAGLAVASVHVQFARKQESYSYTSLSKTVGLIAMFRDDRIMEQSRGEFINGHIRTHEYRYQRTGKKRKNLSIDFDHQQKAALHDENGHKTDIEIPEYAIDEFVTQLALMLDLAAHPEADAKQKFTYDIVDEAKLKQRAFAIEGREQVKTAAGSHDTIKVIRARTKGSRITHFWFAPALNYVPVKIEHIDSNGGKLALELQQVTWAENL